MRFILNQLRSGLYFDQRRWFMEHSTGGKEADKFGKFSRLILWYLRLKPLKEDLAFFKRMIYRNKDKLEGMVHENFRFFVRFPFLEDEDFMKWQVLTDSSMEQGYSRAEFVRSNRLPGGATPNASVASENPRKKFKRVTSDASFTYIPTKPTSSLERDYENPDARTFGITPLVRLPEPTRRRAQIAAAKASSEGNISQPTPGSYGLFRGYLSTKVPEKGDLVRAGFATLRCPELTLFGFLISYSIPDCTHLIIRYRGDGRTYRVNFQHKSFFDLWYFDINQFMLYTRGGPHWQIARIPLHKFYLSKKGRILSTQFALDKIYIKQLSFTLMDDIDGPFSLEIDYIAFGTDLCDVQDFAYEKYKM